MWPNYFPQINWFGWIIITVFVLCFLILIFDFVCERKSKKVKLPKFDVINLGSTTFDQFVVNYGVDYRGDIGLARRFSFTEEETLIFRKNQSQGEDGPLSTTVPNFFLEEFGHHGELFQIIIYWRPHLFRWGINSTQIHQDKFYENGVRLFFKRQQ